MKAPIASILALLCLFANDSFAQCEQAEISPKDLAPSDFYGSGCSASGNRVAVGQSGSIANEAVYVYRQSGRNWFLEQKITNPQTNLNKNSNFGFRLSLDGNRLAIGASFYLTSPGIGAVLIFEFDGEAWVFKHTVVPTSPDTFQGFGESLQLQGDRLIVGNPNDKTIGAQSGAAHVFDFDGTNWFESAKLFGSDTMSGDTFGDAVALDGDRVAVGASFANPGGVVNGGSAYIFEMQGSAWVQTAKIVPADVSSSDSFSIHVSLSGNQLFAGTLGSLLGGASGAVYVFDESGGIWTQSQKLAASDGGFLDNFGVEFDCDGTNLVIGAEGDNLGQGSAYLFRDLGAGWVELGKFDASGGAPNDKFAVAIGVDGDVIVVGASSANSKGLMNTGRAWCFSTDSLLCQSLAIDTTTLSLSQGGTATLSLFPGASEANQNYWVLGSVSGTDPGFLLGTLQFPLNPDSYLSSTLVPSASSPLSGSVGSLDANGDGTALLTLVPLSDPTLVGLRVDHAFVAYSLGPLTFRHVSNPVRVTLVQ